MARRRGDDDSDEIDAEETAKLREYERRMATDKLRDREKVKAAATGGRTAAELANNFVWTTAALFFALLVWRHFVHAASFESTLVLLVAGFAIAYSAAAMVSPRTQSSR